MTSITSLDEDDFLSNLISNNSNPIWLGAELHKDGSKWLDGKPYEYTNFPKNSMKSCKMSKDDCYIVLVPHNNDRGLEGGKWYSYKHQEIKDLFGQMGYICKAISPTSAVIEKVDYMVKNIIHDFQKIMENLSVMTKIEINEYSNALRNDLIEARKLFNTVFKIFENKLVV